MIEELSSRLVQEFGKGFGRRNLFNMIRFAELFPELEKVQTWSAQLSWSHFLEIFAVEDSLARGFYMDLCHAERWSVRTLRDRIRSMLFERTSISGLPTAQIKQELDLFRQEGKMTPDLFFRDPYILDFLQLPDNFTEKDFEAAVLKELERFLLEFGNDFSFLARQQRMRIGTEDFYLDLLFYHRRMRRLVVIELKLGRFTAAYKGQMELYLRWLDRNERREGEEAPLGLILCSEKDQEQVELLELDRGRIRVARYLVQLPPRPLLETKLREAMNRVRERMTHHMEQKAWIE